MSHGTARHGINGGHGCMTPSPYPPPRDPTRPCSQERRQLEPLLEVSGAPSAGASGGGRRERTHSGSDERSSAATDWRASGNSPATSPPAPYKGASSGLGRRPSGPRVGRLSSSLDTRGARLVSESSATSLPPSGNLPPPQRAGVPPPAAATTTATTPLQPTRAPQHTYHHQQAALALAQPQQQRQQHHDAHMEAHRRHVAAASGAAAHNGVQQPHQEQQQKMSLDVKVVQTRDGPQVISKPVTESPRQSDSR